MHTETFNLPLCLAMMLAAAAAMLTAPRDEGAHYRAVGALVVQAITAEGTAEALLSTASGDRAMQVP
ncbi:MAG TPA: hypothetical protein VGG99_15560 [Acetobacteraceae bacterium]|jgi:hypothetical protein